MYHAGVAELADALDLGSSANGVGVQVPPPAPFFWRSTQVGSRGRFAKPLDRVTGARVRIPPSPPNNLPSIDKKSFIDGWFCFI